MEKTQEEFSPKQEVIIATSSAISEGGGRASIPLAKYAALGLSFDEVEETLSYLEGAMFNVHVRPRNQTDATPYEITFSSEFKKFSEPLAEIVATNLLTQYFDLVYQIFEASFGHYGYFPDRALNNYYMQLMEQINTLLELKSLSALKEQMPEMPKNIIGNLQTYDMAWEFMRPEWLAYQGEIEDHWASLHAPQPPIDENEEKFMNIVRDAISDHIQRRERAETKIGLGPHPTQAAPKSAPKPALSVKVTSYDNETGELSLTINNKPVSATVAQPETIENYLLHKVILADGQRLDWTHIDNGYWSDRPDDQQPEYPRRSWINTKDRINKNVRKKFPNAEIGKLVEYQRGSFWLHHSFTQSITKQRK